MLDDVNNDEYKKHHYLGRKNDPSSINHANLLKGTSVLDKSMDTELKKHANSVLMCAKYMDEKNDNSYLNKWILKRNVYYRG